MAIKIDTFPKHQRTRTSKYPWDRWTDGSIWKARYGTDFKAQPESFRIMLFGEARRRDLKVRTTVGEDGDKRPTITFQFYREEA